MSFAIFYSSRRNILLPKYLVFFGWKDEKEACRGFWMERQWRQNQFWWWKLLAARGRRQEIKKTFTHPKDTTVWGDFGPRSTYRLHDSVWQKKVRELCNSNNDKNLLLLWISSVPAAICYQRSIKAGIVAWKHSLFPVIKWEIWSFMEHEKIEIKATKSDINHSLWLIGFAFFLRFRSFNNRHEWKKNLILIFPVFHFEENEK